MCFKHGDEGRGISICHGVHQGKNLRTIEAYASFASQSQPCQVAIVSDPRPGPIRVWARLGWTELGRITIAKLIFPADCLTKALPR